MLIDTHIHLDALAFEADRAALIEAARSAGVGGFVVPATGVGNFDAVAALSREHDDVWHAYGIHPLCLEQAGSEDLALLDQRLAQGDAVAVGEIGLDLHPPHAGFGRQLHFFEAQLQLARLHGLPVIVHARHAVEAVLQALRRHPVAGGIIHAFNGSLQQAAALHALGFRLGFGGTMSYAGSTRIRRLATELPLTAIVLETDAPDMAPVWARGQRNLPANLPRLAVLLAELRGLPLEELADATTRNARAALPGLARP